MRRIHAVDLMLAGTVVLWALNLTLSKYSPAHGLKPLAYSALRYSAAAAIFVGLSVARERADVLRGRQAWVTAAIAVACVFTNQLAFAYALRFTTASTVGLIFGATPIFTALIAFAIGLERVDSSVAAAAAGVGARGVDSSFAAAALVSFAGVAFVALGENGGLSADVAGDLLSLWAALSWGAYSVAVASLMREGSPIRVSAVVLPPTALLLTVAGIPQLAAQDFSAVDAGV